MHRWRVGEVEVVRIAEFDLALPTEHTLPDWCVPELAPTPNEYRVAFSAIAVRDGDTRLVLDPWLVTSRAGDDAAAKADQALAALADADFAPDDVDVVVYSHLDEIGWATRPDGDDWVLTFSNARHLVPAEEIAAVDAGEDVSGADDFRHLRTLTEIEPIADIVQVSPSVTVEPTGGHGWGHAVVRIEDGDDLAIYFGHLILEPLKFVDPGPDPDESSSFEVAAAARVRLLDELADRAGLALTTIVGGPGGGIVARDGDGYRLSFPAA